MRDNDFYLYDTIVYCNFAINKTWLLLILKHQAMMKNSFFLTYLWIVVTSLNLFATPNEIVVHTGGVGNGHNQIYVDPPRVTYDEELNELTVYFGSTGTVDIEYVDTGACSRAEPRSRLSLETLKLLVNSPQN